MRKKTWIGIGAIAAIVVATPAIYAFLALTATTNLTVNEPLSITRARFIGPTGQGSCTISGGTSASCSGSLFAGDTGLTDIFVSNSASAPISVTPTAVSSSSDVTAELNAVVDSTGTTVCGKFTMPPCGTQVSVPGGATYQFTFSISVSQSAVPDSSTVTFNFVR